MEGDDLQDPIADAARAILDGHLVLSRNLADAGVYPAIDLEASISRSMLQIVDEAQMENARLVKETFATYRANQDLINVGAYRLGTDPKIDLAIQSQTTIRDFVRQSLNESCSFAESAAMLASTAAGMSVAQVIEPGSASLTSTALAPATV